MWSTGRRWGICTTCDNGHVATRVPLTHPFFRPSRANFSRRSLNHWPYLLEALADRGELTKVSPDFYYLSSELAEARGRVLARLDEAGEIGVPDFKALFGISRKFAVPLLEFFDREGTTRRVGDRRVRGKCV